MPARICVLPGSRDRSSTAWIVAIRRPAYRGIAFMCCTQGRARLLRHDVPGRTAMLIASDSAPNGSLAGIICAARPISLDGFYTRQDCPELLRRIRFKDPESGKTLGFITNNVELPAATICGWLYKSRGRWNLLQVDQAASSDAKQLATARRRTRLKTQMRIADHGPRPRRPSSRTASTWTPQLLHFVSPRSSR